jgi:hypothetical protein
MDKNLEFPADNKVNNFMIYHQNITGLYNKTDKLLISINEEKFDNKNQSHSI